MIKIQSFSRFNNLKITKQKFSNKNKNKRRKNNRKRKRNMIRIFKNLIMPQMEPQNKNYKD